MPVEMRNIGSQGLSASSLGFGAMGLTAFYGPPTSDDESMKVIKRCLDLGVNLIDTAEVYRSNVLKLREKATGNQKGRMLPQVDDNEDKTITNESVVGKAVKLFGREKFIICTKHIPGGLVGQKCESKEDLRNVIKTACNNSLKELGIETIDLYYLHRLYAKFEIEDVMEVFKELKEEGKIKYVGLSEAPPAVIRRAHKITPITAIQQEWSLIARDLEEKGGIVDTCRELGIGIVPYSPIARGFLTSEIPLPGSPGWGSRDRFPYMSQENMPENIKIIQEIEALAKEKRVSLAQLSLAWVINQGVDVFPIPGTTKIAHLEENIAAANVKLTKEEITKIEEAASKLKGERGNEEYMKRSFKAFQ